MNNPYISFSWLDRISEYPTRRQITSTSDPTDVKQVYVARDEGDITEQGTPYTAERMNSLESRINAAFAAIVAGLAETLTGTTDPAPTAGKNGDTYYKTETEAGETSVVAVFVKISGEWLEVATGGAALPQAEGGGF